jgi:hypothetical protein
MAYIVVSVIAAFMLFLVFWLARITKDRYFTGWLLVAVLVFWCIGMTAIAHG